ncbi:MAG: type II toxin-antitoxin system VapC family toxin [Pseudomonadota bacterium]
MIAVDTSALVAILEQEPDAGLYAEALEADPAPVLSTANLIELQIVMRYRRGAVGRPLIERLMEQASIEPIPVSVEQARLAADAHARFGALNFGDSFAYALAQERDVPLLFKGDDFTRTDIRKAVNAS